MKNAAVSEVTLFLVPRNATSYENTVGFPRKPDFLKTGTVVKDWGQKDTISGVVCRRPHAPTGMHRHVWVQIIIAWLQ